MKKLGGISSVLGMMPGLGMGGLKASDIVAKGNGLDVLANAGLNDKD